MRPRTNLEQTLAAAVELHAEADAAGLTGAGELAEQSGQDGAGQGLLQGGQRLYNRIYATIRCFTREHTNSVQLEREDMEQRQLSLMICFL